MKHKQKGQMLVIILLITIVGLTIGLFLLGRTTTDISLTGKITDSTRAFNAAEAGVEDAIRSLGGVTQGSPVPFASGTTYTVNTASLGTSGLYPSVKEEPLTMGKSLTVWFVPHDDTTGAINEVRTYTNNILDICFTQNAPTPAIGATLFFKQSGTYKSSYVGYDPVPASRNPVNNFQTADSVLTNCGGNGGGYNYHAQINFNTHFGVNPASATITLLALRLRPVYASASVGVSPAGGAGGVLPKQGNDIDARGTAGQATRRINVDDLYKVPAPFMDNAMYSIDTGTDIQK